MKKRRVIRRAGARSAKQQDWANSTEFREMGRAMMKRFNRQRRLGPKCEARTKADGHPCQNPAMKNGRCRLHGGATPKGDGWHKPVWPATNAANWNERLSRKLADLDRAKEKRVQLLRQMTQEQRDDYEAWLTSHTPGSAAAREMRRKERRDMASFFSAQDLAPASQELLALDKAIARLRARIELDEAKARDEGVLG